MIKISASILASDFGYLAEEVSRVTEAGADFIHIDVMDGSFVPNITVGSMIVKAVKKYTHLPLDVHLMIEKPERYVDEFIDAGSDLLTVHAEAYVHLEKIVNNIKKSKIKVGVSLVPSTNESVLEYLYDQLDLILVMTVNPGFGGQTFLSSQLKKIENIRNKVNQVNKNIYVSVDGGINLETASYAKKAGANFLVAGTAIFKSEDYKKSIRAIKEAM